MTSSHDFTVDLAGRTALVTGASSGFGARFGTLLAQNGARVALGARRIDRLEALAEEIGQSAAAVQMDVAREADIIAGFDAAEEAFGTVDTVIANAGIDSGKPMPITPGVGLSGNGARKISSPVAST